MHPTRDAARSLAKDGRIVVMQKGNVLGVDEEYRGPIRLRLFGVNLDCHPRETMVSQLGITIECDE